LKNAALADAGVSPTTIELTVQKHPRNPDIICMCLASLSRQGEIGRLIQHSLTYLEPSNGYSDVIREAVIDALPVIERLLTSFDGFKMLRLGLTDDDEEIRLATARKVQSLLCLGDLSLPATLEALHKVANKKWPGEYKQWLKTLETVTQNSPSSEFVLFEAEPLNLFVNPTWERHIMH
jgi:hypothetical protein